MPLLAGLSDPRAKVGRKLTSFSTSETLLLLPALRLLLALSPINVSFSSRNTLVRHFQAFALCYLMTPLGKATSSPRDLWWVPPGIENIMVLFVLLSEFLSFPPPRSLTVPSLAARYTQM